MPRINSFAVKAATPPRYDAALALHSSSISNTIHSNGILFLFYFFLRSPSFSLSLCVSLSLFYLFLSISFSFAAKRSTSSTAASEATCRCRSNNNEKTNEQKTNRAIHYRLCVTYGILVPLLFLSFATAASRVAFSLANDHHLREETSSVSFHRFVHVDDLFLCCCRCYNFCQVE